MSVSVYLYKPSDRSVVVEKLGDYLGVIFPSLSVVVRDDFISHHLKGACDKIAFELAESKVIDPNRDFIPNEPLPGEIAYEEKILKGTPAGGIIYDAVRLSHIYGGILPVQERNLSNIHIVFTDRLIATFDKDDHRYHARVMHASSPSIVSTSGFIEAPAKPKEYYLEKGVLGNDPLTLASLKKRFSGEILDYGDARLTEVAKGYVLQIIVYLLTGEAFCSDKSCRLFNAHWQSEVIGAQLSMSEFCPRHQRLLAGMTDML